LRKPKSVQCQAWKAWDKQTPETARAEGKKTSREAHSKTVLGVGKVAKNSEEAGNRKRGSRPSKEDSAGSFKESLKRQVKAKQEALNQ